MTKHRVHRFYVPLEDSPVRLKPGMEDKIKATYVDDTGALTFSFPGNEKQEQK